jgi:transcriptional regulator with GAF, ATPase, and Fis domain
LTQATEITSKDLLLVEESHGDPEWYLGKVMLGDGFCMEGYLASLRKTMYERALQEADGNQSAAARLLGVTPQAVFKYIKSR